MENILASRMGRMWVERYECGWQVWGLFALVPLEQRMECSYSWAEEDGTIGEYWKEAGDDYGREEGQLDLEPYCELYSTDSTETLKDFQAQQLGPTKWFLEY